ncbi:MAG: nucleoside hydrolase [Spirochaetota bacterium]
MTELMLPPPNPGSGTRPRVVLDTDTYNEIDDQFAVAYLLRSADVARPEALYAAPFHNKRSESPGDGMEKSYEEIRQLLARLNMDDFPHFRGADRTLPDTSTPVESDAARDMVERGMSATHSDRLVVIAIGAITNVASALLMEPRLADRCTVVWLGGNYPYWPANTEFNLNGDVTATGVVFDSGVPLYVVPAMGVSSHLTTTREELAAYLDLDQPLSRFLYERFAAYGPASGVWSKEIWDIAGVAWLVRPESVSSFAIPAPRIAADGSYIHDPRRHPCRFAYRLDRDSIYKDLFARLSAPQS